jgi:hypothetical protein
MVTDEDFPFYYRVRLNEYISEDITEQDLIAKKDAWYGDRNIDLRLKTRILGVEPREKAVIAENNQRLTYDCLLIATGSHSFIPPIKGSEKGEVFALRSIQDARDIAAFGKDIEEVVLSGIFPKAFAEATGCGWGKETTRHHGRDGVFLQAWRQDGRDHGRRPGERCPAGRRRVSLFKDGYHFSRGSAEFGTGRAFRSGP